MKTIVQRGKRLNNDPGYTATLMKEILASVSVDKHSGCWVWAKSLQNNGYGQKRAFGQMMPAHRASWLAFRGSLTPGLEVAHCCGNKRCVNPGHLKEITHAQNMRERAISGNDGRRTVRLDGAEYSSVADAAACLNVARATIRFRERKEENV